MIKRGAHGDAFEPGSNSTRAVILPSVRRRFKMKTIPGKRAIMVTLLKGAAGQRLLGMWILLHPHCYIPTRPEVALAVPRTDLGQQG